MVIYPNDYLPCHVHVFKGGGEVIIRLGNETNQPTIDRIYGVITNKEIGKVLQIVRANHAKLLAAWQRIHG